MYGRVDLIVLANIGHLLVSTTKKALKFTLIKVHMVANELPESCLCLEFQQTWVTGSQCKPSEQTQRKWKDLTQVSLLISHYNYWRYVGFSFLAASIAKFP